MSQQLQGRDDHFEAVGKFLLGLEPDTTFLERGTRERGREAISPDP